MLTLKIKGEQIRRALVMLGQGPLIHQPTAAIAVLQQHGFAAEEEDFPTGSDIQEILAAITAHNQGLGLHIQDHLHRLYGTYGA